MRTAIIISTFLQVSLLHHFSSTHRPSSAASWGTLKSIFLYQFVNGKLEIINLVFHAPIYLFILFLWGYFFPNKQIFLKPLFTVVLYSTDHRSYTIFGGSPKSMLSSITQITCSLITTQLSPTGLNGLAPLNPQERTFVKNPLSILYCCPTPLPLTVDSFL